MACAPRLDESHALFTRGFADAGREARAWDPPEPGVPGKTLDAPRTSAYFGINFANCSHLHSHTMKLRM